MQLVYNHFLNHTGYSIAAQDYILSMLSFNPGIDIKSVPYNISIRSGISLSRQNMFNRLIQVKLKPPFICLSHSTPDRFIKLKGASLNVGFCIFETISIPDTWVKQMNTMDLIITASDFNKNCFIQNGVKTKVSVIPHCFDPDIFNDKVESSGKYNLFTFLAMGTWRKRKNWEVLIKAFYREFSEKDNVCLLIKTDKSSEMQSMITMVKKSNEYKGKSTAPIFLESNSLCAFEEIPKIMSKADVYINTSLGEGFGYCGLHAMALGIPIIVTKFGGSLEYAKPELCTYLEPSGYVTIPNLDNFPQFRNAVWPKIEENEICSKMRWSLDNFSILKLKAKLGYNFVHTLMTYSTIGKKLTNELGF